MRIVSVEEIQAIEKSADAGGLSYERMMRNAGKGVADWVSTKANIQHGVIGLVGSGNNGGDTLIALTELAQRGARTLAFVTKAREGDPLIDDYIQAGGDVVDISQGESLDVLEGALRPGVVLLDGILGTGLKLPIRGKLQDVMASVHHMMINQPGVLRIAVDCPSGVDCDSGEASEVTLPAEDTLCMAAMKQGLLKHPARALAGELHLIDIGLDEISKHISKELPRMITQEYVLLNLPKRPSSGHKGTFGTCLIVAGSDPFTGAAFLAGKGAYRAGCGLVHIGTLPTVKISLAGQLIEAVWTVLPVIDGSYDPEGVLSLQTPIEKADSLVVGPGWGLSDHNEAFLGELLPALPEDLPTLFDADGLKLLSNIEHWWELLPKNTILTPHPGEMSILSGLEVSDIQSDRWHIAQEYAQKWGLILVLKGAETVIAQPNGDIFVNPISDSALATAGSGDVLAGVIGGLLAQGLSPEKAAVSGVWLHAQAGMIARAHIGTDVSVTALDILACVGDAFVKIKEAGDYPAPI